ncbi:cytochrome c oxidase subunit II [Ferrimonas aestuarii]|uniref:cytochrome-c oxidase n=1 Tax=Ferrimonas aestuarii TaxID=2569539 RepID=A0A4U1BMT0_9GAMM|nr:cytochrome c oxidase subunit II [Ferrimonas aestuarii]TKB52037.1 c-type cytochrome [Ferrimonas aestuarii]
MILAVVLVLLLVASLWFHFAGNWQLPALASNWGDIDTTIVITLIITGVVFIAVVLFMAWTLYRYRYRQDAKSEYQPEDKKLEYWLTGATAIGITLMLVPGLYVYSDVVSVPEDAHEVEVLAEQWRWQFRLAGDDGLLGKTDIKRISPTNPFGIDPTDPAGQDDKLVTSNELHLPIDRPVHLKLRSKDVLHDFYVPQFRNKMDAVPGIVSSLWLTPTELGRFEILCAELCGVGHFNMRGAVVVEPVDHFIRWLDELPSFAQGTLSSVSASLANPLSAQAQEGQALAESQGCMACHGFKDSPLAPSWKGLYGKTELLSDGSEVVADDAYLAESITNPGAKIVKGYANVMPAYPLSELQLSALITYIKEQGGVVSPLPNSAQPSAPISKPPPESVKQSGPSAPVDGKQLVTTKGCIACHSVDGGHSLGPTWLGLFGRERPLASGERVIADEAYLRRAISEPNSELVQGYGAIMPAQPLTEAEINALITYIKTLAEKGSNP